MLSRFMKPGYKDRFAVSFLDRNGHMVRMRVFRRRLLGVPCGVNAWTGTISINGRVTVEVQSPDPDMLTHCLVREAWNREPGTAQGPRRAVIAE